MARRTGIHIGGSPLHIVQRGHNWAACLFGDQDRRTDLGCLREALTREHCRLHGCGLMTNHVHLLLTQEHAARGTQALVSIDQWYVQYINHTYGRTGTLWDGRYKSSLTQAEAYLLPCQPCQPCIELNPEK